MDGQSYLMCCKNKELALPFAPINEILRTKLILCKGSQLQPFLGSMLPQYMTFSVRSLCYVMSLRVCVNKKMQDTSKQGRRLRFGMLTVLTNLRSTKVRWQVEDNLRWKTAFDGKQPLVEDVLWRKTTYSYQASFKEDNLRRKTTLGGR